MLSFRDRLKKPEQWGFDRGLVDLEWEALWRDAVIAVPNWEGSTQPFDYVGRARSDISGLVQPAWTANALGVVTNHSGSSSTSAGTARAFRLVERPNMDVSELTFMAVAKLTVPTAATKQLFNRGSGTAGSWAIFLDSAGDLSGQIRVNGGTARKATILDANLPADGTQCLFAVTYKAPDTIVYCFPIGGGSESQATQSTGGTLDTGTGNLYLGCHPNTQGDSDWHEDVSYWFAAGRAFALEQLRKVARDLFGPFRMVDEAAFFVPAVVAGRIMSSLAGSGGLAARGGIAGPGGGLAGA